MAYTITTDISRMIVAGQKEIFLKNYDPYPVEWVNMATRKSQEKKVETYDSMGNLAAAEEKVEGAPIPYRNISQAYQTSVTMKTFANGFAHTLEAIRFDLYGVINSVKAKELANTMRTLEEENFAKPWNDAFDTNLTDGVPLCTNSRPLVNTAGTFNDTLATGALTPDNVKSAVQQFAVFKTHTNKPMKSVPKRLITHAWNMMTVEEILLNQKKAYELSNTENRLPNLQGVYSHFLTNTGYWFLQDPNYEHVLACWNMDTVFDNDEDKRDTKNLYVNAVAIYREAALPNVGIVGSSGA